MAHAVDVPQNTMLADMDEALRQLLLTELRRQRFDGAAVSFEAPTGQWSSGLSAPTINVFLYDLREAAEQPGDTWREHRANGSARLERPPLRLDCTYAITAWARAVEDEHRLLSQVLAILLAHQRLPAELLGERLAPPGEHRPILGRVGQPKGDGKAEFWSAIGGQYKVSLDYVVTLPCDPGVTYARGPEVRSHGIEVTDRARSGRVREERRTGPGTDGSGSPPA
jgi:Pvc16 N-terminal domain